MSNSKCNSKHNGTCDEISCSRSTPGRGKLWHSEIPAAAGAGKRLALAAHMMFPSNAEDAGAAAAQLNVTASWGAQLNGGAGCTDYFVPGKLHFKNNFYNAFDHDFDDDIHPAHADFCVRWNAITALDTQRRVAIKTHKV